jgi:hypothetical protein
MAYEVDEPDQVGGVRLNPKMILGHLLVVWVTDYIEHSPTKYTVQGKPSDVVVVDCIDLDQVDEPTGEVGLIARNCWWRQSRLIQLLKTRVGKPNPILIRITQGSQANSPYEAVSQRSDEAAMTRLHQWAQRNPNFVPSVKRPRDDQEEFDQGQVDVPSYEQVRQMANSMGSGPGPQRQIPETPAEAAERLARGQEPTNVTLDRLRAMGQQRGLQGQLQEEKPPF